MTEEKKKIALVLSSGGARGLAEIGVIEGLVEDGHEITSIAGSSMGSMVGAFYACGKLDEYKEWVCKLERLDVFKLIDFTFSVNGFIRGEKVFKEMKKFIPDTEIESLPIPFCAVATDLKSKKEVVLDKGSMYRAIQASVAIPTVIKPQEIDNKRLIDGGVTNPIPINHVKRHKGDTLVVVDVNANIPYKPTIKNKEEAKKQEQKYLKKIREFKINWSSILPGNNAEEVKDPEEKLGYFELLSRSIDLMQDKLCEMIIEHYKPSLTVQISRDAANTFEFYKAKELIELGRKAYEKAKKDWKEQEAVEN